MTDTNIQNKSKSDKKDKKSIKKSDKSNKSKSSKKRSNDSDDSDEYPKKKSKEDKNSREDKSREDKSREDKSREDKSNSSSSSDDDKTEPILLPRSLEFEDFKESNNTEYTRFENNKMNGILGALLGMKAPNKSDCIRKRIIESFMTEEMKHKLFKKLDKTSMIDPKLEEWFDNLLSIPFGKFSPLPIDIVKDDVGKYFVDLMKTLNEAVYGLDNVKEEIINYVAQCLTSKNPSPRILALQGSAGVGKTKIVRNGIAKVLKTPMQTFSMGGIKDSSHFVGFDYTYQNSKYGAISQALMDSEVMNPVIFLDELDKISDWYEGEEVKNLLIHMTDPVQNHEFKDKYFEGLNIDLSKVIFIFAFNDIEKINPILRDRLHIIKITNPSDKDKLKIVNEYIINELLENITLSKDDFKITDQAIMSIIQKYSNKNSGIRSIKDCIRTILLKINTLKLLGKQTIKKIGLSFDLKDKNTERNEIYSFPIVIDEQNINVFLGSYNTPDDKYLSMYM